MLSDLHDGELRVVGRLVDASNATLLCDIGSEEEPVQVIYKPIAGERALWDFPDGELAKREVAAFLLSKSLDYNIVPETIFRDGPFGLGSVQRWIDVDESIDVVELAQSQDPLIRKMALFDVLINNTDRKFGHILPTHDGSVFGCDHEDNLRTVLWQFAGEPLTESELVDMSRILASLPQSGVAEFLNEADQEALVRRIERVKSEATFPFPSEDWPAVPWPPF